MLLLRCMHPELYQVVPDWAAFNDFEGIIAELSAVADPNETVGVLPVSFSSSIDMDEI